MNLQPYRLTGALALLLTIFIAAPAAANPVALFDSVGVPETVTLPEHVLAAQPVRVNQRAFRSPVIEIELFGELVVAVRTRVEQQRAGQFVWIGHIEGSPGDTVILTRRGNYFSAQIQHGANAYRLGIGPDARNRLFELDLASLPPDDADALPDGGGSFETSGESVTAGDAATTQDLLVVYTQGACNYAGGCGQLEADIVTAVADINTAYAASGIDIVMNLAGMALTDYAGTDASVTLSALRSTTDGAMDEVHPLRDELGADIVSLVYRGQGCGIGYLRSSAAYAFSVTDLPCLVGNRTMAHEIGHNQGAHHDRQSVGTTSTTTYNYGFRRCNDGSVDNLGSPYFRTVLSYACNGAVRVGRFSNPNINYSGVPQGVDPDLDPKRGAYNARTLNESAAYVAGFRTAAVSTPPAAPSELLALATGPNAVTLDWLDNASDEQSFTVQRATDASFSAIATLAANVTSFSDDGLTPDTAYQYRVRANNGAGSSDWSNTATANTEPAPPIVEDFASSDLFISGTVSGSYSDTQAADDIVEAITESHSGGPKKSRRQSYAHAWTFDVFGGGGGSIVTVEAWVSGSEGAQFYYSLDGGTTLNPMFTANANGPGDRLSFTLPAGTSGPVRIEVRDAEQSNGEAVDTVYIDQLLISSYTNAGEPPLAPSGLTIDSVTATRVSLSFTDNSEDEFGFEIWRKDSANAPIDCNDGAPVGSAGASLGSGGSIAFTDSSVAPQSTYSYWAKSFNGGGEAGCSNSAPATTPVAPASSLTVSAYKVKGVHQADLAWTGISGTGVVIYRDNVQIVPVSAGNGTATDETGAKGSGSYVYRVCETTAQVSCTPEATAAF